MTRHCTNIPGEPAKCERKYIQEEVEKEFVLIHQRRKMMFLVCVIRRSSYSQAVRRGVLPCPGEGTRILRVKGRKFDDYGGGTRQRLGVRLEEARGPSST